MAGFQPAYPQGLSELFDSGNLTLIAPMMEQFNTAQGQAKQNLSLSEQMFRQNEETHPVELDQKRALAENYRAQGRHNDMLTRKTEDEINALPPQEQRKAAALAKLMSEQSADQLKQMDNHMRSLGALAAAAKSNGGTVPLQYVTPENQQFIAQLSRPGGVDAALKAVEHHNRLLPAFQQAMETGALHNQGTANVASIQAASHERIAKAERDRKNNINTSKRNDIIAGGMARGEPGAFMLAALEIEDTDPAKAEELRKQGLEAEARRVRLARVKQEAAIAAGDKKPDINRLLGNLGQGDLPPVAPTPQSEAPKAPLSFEEFQRLKKEGKLK